MTPRVNQPGALVQPDGGGVTVGNTPRTTRANQHAETAEVAQTWQVGRTTVGLDATGRPASLVMDPESGAKMEVKDITYAGNSRRIQRVAITHHREDGESTTILTRQGNSSRWSRTRNGQRINDWTGDIAINGDNEYAFRSGTQRDAHGDYAWKVFDHECGEGLTVYQDTDGASRTVQSDGTWKYRPCNSTHCEEVGESTLHLDERNRPRAIELQPDGGEPVLISDIQYRGDSRSIQEVTLVEQKDGKEQRTTFRQHGSPDRWTRIVDGVSQGTWRGYFSLRPDNSFGYASLSQRRDQETPWTVYDLETATPRSVVAYADGSTRTMRSDGGSILKTADDAIARFNAQGHLESLKRADGSEISAELDEAGRQIAIQTRHGDDVVRWVKGETSWVAHDQHGNCVVGLPPSETPPVDDDLNYRYFDGDGTLHVVDSTGTHRTLRASRDLESAKVAFGDAFRAQLRTEGASDSEIRRRAERTQRFIQSFEARERRLAVLRGDGALEERQDRAHQRVKSTLDALNGLLTDGRRTVYEQNGNGRPVVTRAELAEQALYHYGDVTTVDQSWNACQMATAERCCMWNVPDVLAEQVVETVFTGQFKTTRGHTVAMPYRSTLYPGGNERAFDLDREPGPGYRSPWNQVVQHMLGNAYNRAHGSRSVYRSQHGWTNPQTTEATQLVTGHTMKYRWDYGRNWQNALRHGEILGTTGNRHAWAYVPELTETPDGRVVVRTYVDDNSWGERRDQRRRLP